MKNASLSKPPTQRQAKYSLVIAFLFNLFFSPDKSQWTQPLDNSSWNNSYKWMSLVFSPVAHCGVEVYAISVGCEKKQHWQTPGAHWSEPKVACCLDVCEAVADRVGVLLHQCESDTRGGWSHSSRPCPNCFIKPAVSTGRKKKKDLKKKKHTHICHSANCVWWQRVGRRWQVLHYAQPLNYELTSAAGCALLESK